MEPSKPLDPGAKIKTFPLPNGALKKINHPRSSPPPAAADSLYRECLKNHAATLGGHAVDGCGEFMPSPAFNPADPTSLTCAACGCHRNFHRRIPLPPPTSDEIDGHDDSPDDDEAHRSSSSPPPYFSSAPHMLLALSAGLSAAGPTAGPAPPQAAAAAAAAGEVGPPVVPARKRFRTRFSPEQKGRMQELSEKLGWRMQKRDEGLIEEWCREIGVGKGVFKVWMHNNKHSYLGGGRRGGDANGGDGGGGAAEIQGKGGGGGGGGSGVEGSSHVVNGSSSS